MFSKLENWANHSHDYAKEWKQRTGGKVIGYFCTYAPEEIMYAAGILPVRLTGSREPQNVTEPHIFGGMYCPFCRDVLAQGLLGRYDYLDGIMIAHSCLHMRQSFSSWKIHIPTDFTYYLGMPNHVQSPRALTFLTKELGNFKSAIEEWLGKPISDEALENSINVYNTNRRLMRQIYEMRKNPNPQVTGLEAMNMVLSSQVTDKEEHNRELLKIIEGLPARKLDNSGGVRLMLVGSEQNDTDFVAMLESINGSVVIDDHCTGSRYFWNETPAQGDLLYRIAKRYVDRPRCPSKDWPERQRLSHIKKLVEDYQVQGVIVIQQKFCDPHEADGPVIESMLKDMDIPTYPLEFDVTVPVGQFKIRLEAFIEMFEQDLLF